VDGYGLSLSNAGKVFIRLNQATSGETYRINSITNYPLNNTAWMHVAATYDGTTIKLYINGVLENSIAGPAAIATNSLPLTLGAKSDGSRFYNGMLDEARVYATALSAAEIAALANPGATNSAPVAIADSYSTAQDTALVQAAPGVLANDTDADSNPLTAVLVTNVSHGILSLAANGGFTYTPTTGYSGPDSFTYKANDGTIDSNTVTVSLTVTAPAATLVGAWQMENNAQDSSTYANHGSLVGSPAVAGQTPGLLRSTAEPEHFSSRRRLLT
jgi:VCBS repeat-containing protein